MIGVHCDSLGNFPPAYIEETLLYMIAWVTAGLILEVNGFGRITFMASYVVEGVWYRIGREMCFCVLLCPSNLRIQLVLSLNEWLQSLCQKEHDIFDHLLRVVKEIDTNDLLFFFFLMIIASPWGTNDNSSKIMTI